LIAVDELIEHQEYRSIRRCVGRVEDCPHKIAEAFLEKDRVIKSYPPDASGGDVDVEEVAYRLIERGGLADASGSEHKLEATGLIVLEP
jgi:hypothetical protein